MFLNGLKHITLRVVDIEKSFYIYTEILGFTPHLKWDNRAYFTLKDLWLCVNKDTVYISNDYTHISFSVAQKDFIKFKEYLAKHGIKNWKTNTSEGDSLYILDPDAHKLEIHVGSLRSRLEHIKNSSYPYTKFYM